MKIGQIGMSYSTLLNFSRIAALNFKESYALDRLLLELKSDAEHYLKKELEILKKYGKERASIPGKFDIPEPNQVKVGEELKELRDVESQVIFEKIQLCSNDLKMRMRDNDELKPLRITAYEISLLKPVYRFPIRR